jgi:hypothetical protein
MRELPTRNMHSKSHARLKTLFTPSNNKYIFVDKSIENFSIMHRTPVSRDQKGHKDSKEPQIRPTPNKSSVIPNLNLSMKLHDLPQVGKRFKFLINDINQHKDHIQQVRDKTSALFLSKPAFKNASFEKYIFSKEKPLDSTNKEYKITLTTSHCKLGNSQILLERFDTPQHKTPKNINTCIKRKNFKIKLDTGTKSFSIIENQSPLRVDKQQPSEDVPFKNIPNGARFKGALQGIRNSISHSVLQKNADVRSIQRKIDESSESFKINFNQKLLAGMFYYNLKLNKKATVVKILKLNPHFLKSSDQYGKYPIHYAVSLNLVGMTRILVGLSSPIEVKDRLGNSPLDFAYANKNSKIVKVS